MELPCTNNSKLSDIMAAINRPQYTQTLTAVTPVSESAHLLASYLHKLSSTCISKKILIKTLQSLF